MLFKVELVGGSPWGFRLEDGVGADGEHSRRVKIAKMNASSKAHSRGIQVGDIIHSINGQSVAGLSSSSVMQIVRNAGDALSLELIRGHPFSSTGDVSSSGISSADSPSYISPSSSISANYGTHSSTSSSLTLGESSPFADKTNRLSTFGQKPVKFYHPVSFEVLNGAVSSQQEQNVNTNAPKSLLASEFTSDRDHGHQHNSYGQENKAFASDRTKLNGKFTSSDDTTDNETSLNRFNLEKDRTSNSAGLISARPTSHSMDFDYSIPSVSASPNSRNPKSVSSLNLNISDGQSRLPVVKNPTIALLQRKRAERQLSKSLTSFEDEPLDRISLSNSFISKPASELSSSETRQPESSVTGSQQNSTDRLKKWKGDRFLNRENEMEESFSQSGIDAMYEKQDKHSESASSSQNSIVDNFSTEKWNQRPSEASLQNKVQAVARSDDSRYAGAGVIKSQTDPVPSERKYVRFEGIGPVDEKTGVLIATRSSVDEINQKDWYREMYKSLHKSAGDLDSLYVFPGRDDESNCTGRTRRKSTHEVTYTIRKAIPEDKNVQRYASTPSLADVGLEDQSPSSSSSKNAGAKNNRGLISSTTESSKSGQSSTPSSPRKKPSESWTPAQFKYESRPYKVQPKRIEDYEPGRSSVLQKDGHQFYSSVGNLYSEEVYTKPSRRSESKEGSDLRLNERPFWKSTSALDQESIGQKQRNSVRQNLADEAKQLNGKSNLPLVTTTSTSFKTSASTDKVNSNKWDMENNGFRRYPAEERDSSGLSHSHLSTSAQSNCATRDQPVTTVQRSQYDVKPQNSPQKIQPTARNDVTNSITSAKAVYSFRAQSPTDLSFCEGDSVYIFDRIDDNWYKGECNGKVGKFPISFVERQNSGEGGNSPETQTFGKGYALYDFNAQTVLELSFKKNDEITLVSRVNKDWFEARTGRRNGFVPANYIEIIKEPSLRISPKKAVSPQESTRPSLTSASSLSASESTLSSAMNQNLNQGKNSTFRNNLYNGSHLALAKNASHQWGNNVNVAMHGKSTAGTPTHENKSLTNQKMADRNSQSDKNTAEYFRSKDHLKNDHLRPRPTSVFANGPLKTSNPDNNVVSQPVQQSYEFRTPTSGVAGTNAGGAKLVPVKTATVWPTHIMSAGNKVPAPNNQGFGNSSRYLALFAYNPQRADELELNKGDVVYVMEKYDDGWFVGMSEKTKKLGSFPGNYVEALW